MMSKGAVTRTGKMLPRRLDTAYRPVEANAPVEFSEVGWPRPGLLSSVALCGLLLLAAGCVQAGTTKITEGPAAVLGLQGDDSSDLSRARAISADGRFVAFTSDATNLVAGDTNDKTDIFVRDTASGTTTRVSLNSAGVQGNNVSGAPAISPEGRYVAFQSKATNLVVGDTNGKTDIFVRDTVSGTTTRLSLDSTGVQGNNHSDTPTISADGSYVAFASDATNLVAGDTNGRRDIFVHDTAGATTTRVSLDSVGTQGSNGSYDPTISANGRFVSFRSYATDLVVGDTNNATDIFVHDTATGATTRVSLDSAGAQGNNHSDAPAISPVGRYVVFQSKATNLVADDTNGRSDIFVHDTTTGATTRVSVDSSGNQGNGNNDDPAISADGRYVAFASDATNLVMGDINGRRDVVVHDTVTGTTTRVSLDSFGAGANSSSNSPAISADGGYVAFASVATNLVEEDTNAATDIFVHDTAGAATVRVSLSSDGPNPGVPNDDSFDAAISADGRYVAFASWARNLVMGGFNGFMAVFVHDAATGTTAQVSLDSSGVPALDIISSPAISADGRYVAFASPARNLVAGDTNNSWDIFVHDTHSGTTIRESLDSAGTQGNGRSEDPTFSADGRYLAYHSDATNLVAGDTNGKTDIFVHDRIDGTTIRVSLDGAGAEGDGSSRSPAISADGRYVAYYSDATNLVTGDTNNLGDIFLHDTAIGTTTRVSLDSAGLQSNGSSQDPVISNDGRYVSYNSSATNLVEEDTNAVADIFVHDTRGGVTTRVSLDSVGVQGDGNSSEPAISADGRYVAFNSSATNLVAEDTNARRDIFVRDTHSGTTIRVSLDNAGVQGDDHSYGSAISADGLAVAFESDAWNLAPNTGPYREIFLNRRAPPGGTSTTTTIVSDDPDPSVVGETLNVTFVVSGDAPTGNVTVIAATGEICNGPLSGGTGGCSLAFGTTGNRDLTAKYAGDAGHLGSRSDPVSHQVKPVPDPKANFSVTPDPAACNQPVAFDGRASTPGHPIRTLTSWAWDIDADGTPDAIGETARHSFAAFGTYQVTLTVTDDGGAQASDTRSLQVNQGNRPPAVHAGGPYGIPYGASVTLDGTASTDPDAACGDTIAGHAWDIDGDGQYDDATGATPRIPWTPLLAALGVGSHDIGLRISDGFGAMAIATTTLSIAASADLAVTKTDGVSAVVAGHSLTYTIVAANMGPTAVTEATLSDSFPAPLACSWTSVAIGGATGAGAGTGNLNETLALPAGSMVTYSAHCATPAGVGGTLSNIATIASSVHDPAPDNNSASDSDTVLMPAAILITESDGRTEVDESASSDSFEVVLNVQPLDRVRIIITVGDPAEATVDTTDLVFTGADWNRPRTVTVTGVDDLLIDGDRTSTLVLYVDDANSDNAFDAVADKTVTVTTSDDDSAGFTVTQSDGNTVVSESGTRDTFKVTLDTRPFGNVIIGVTSADTDEAAVDTAELIFTPDDWDSAQTVTVTGVDDDLIDGTRKTTITLGVIAERSDDTYDTVADRIVDTDTTDDDAPGFTATETQGATAVSESGSEDTLTVVLDMQPAADVVIDVTSADIGEVDLNPARLTFTPDDWSMPQTLTVTGIDDTLVDGDQITTLTLSVDTALSDGAFAAVSERSLSVTTSDDDSADFSVTESNGGTEVNETGTVDTFSVVLDLAPTTGVVIIDLIVDNPSEAELDKTRLRYTLDDWDKVRTVTVIGVDDELSDGHRTSTLTLRVNAAQSDAAFADVADRTLEVITIDDELDADPPLIESVHFDDRDGNRQVSPGDRYRFVFSEPMVTAALHDATTDANDRLPPDGARYGTLNAISWNPEATAVTITVTDGYTLNGTETVTPAAAVTDRSGNALANTVHLTTRDTLAPRLDSVTANVPNPVYPRSDYRLSLHFDSAMDPAATPVIAIEGAGTPPIELSTGTWSSTVHPDDTYTTGDILIDDGHAGTWRVSVTAARDPAGNPMQAAANPHSFSAAGTPGFSLSNFAPAPHVNDWNVTQATLRGLRHPATAVRIDGIVVSPAGSEDWSATVTLAEGSNSIQLYALDTNGQVAATLGVLIAVDITPPAAPLVDAYPAETTRSVQTFTGAKEADSGLWLDGASVVASSAATDWRFATALAAGDNHFQLSARDAADNASDPVTLRVTRRPVADNDGPVLSQLRYAGTPLEAGAQLTRSGAITVAAADPGGVSRVDFHIDGTLLGADSDGADGYATRLDLLTVTDGPHTLGVQAVDTLGNTSELNHGISVAIEPPSAPLLSAPADGLLTNQASVTVAGTAMRGSEVLIDRNGVRTGTVLATDADGGFSGTLTLETGLNQIQAAARHRGGEGPRGAMVTVTLDDSLPGAPGGLSATRGTAGQVTLRWNSAPGNDVTGYHIYRASQPFAATMEAQRVNAGVITATRYDDLIADDGSYYYRAVALNGLGSESTPSNQSDVHIDTTPPRALSILYSPQGPSDPDTGRIAQGRVDIELRVSEPLLTTPFLSLATDGGAPLTAVLERVTDTGYRGHVDITPYAGTGTAYAVFSARDLAANRGTAVDLGATLEIDTKGPHAVRIDVLPEHPIRNDGTAPVAIAVTLELDELIGAGSAPSLAFKPSLSDIALQPIPLTSNDDRHWHGSATLPADAGQGTPELLLFSYHGVDDLGNASSNILDSRRVQIYQGELPPLDVPADCSAQALPGGEVELRWQAVDEAVDYQIFRQAPGEATLTPLLRSNGALVYLDAPEQDGLHAYGVASVRAANAGEAMSAPCQRIEIKADALAPPAPTELELALRGNGIEAVWSSSLTDEAVTYRLYRDSFFPVTDVADLQPVAAGITETRALDPAPIAGLFAYTVTAVDAAGNESPPSETAYLNFELLPVSSFHIIRAEGQPPVLTWTHGGSTIAYYDIYLGERATGMRLNDAPLIDTSYTDIAAADDERLYTVVAVDDNGHESVGRSLLLPRLLLEPLGSGEIHRGTMNRLEYQITNLGETPIRGARLVLQAAGRSHRSEPFSVEGGQGALAAVVVGGYAELSDPELLTLTLEIIPDVGESVTLQSALEAPVGDAGLHLAVAVKQMLRGGHGQIQYTLENSAEVALETITARANGHNPSDETLIKLLDADGNVLSTARPRQVLGAGVINLANGATVARIPPGGRFTSDWVHLTLPAVSPDQVTVQVEIDALHYRYGQDTGVTIAGVGARQTVPLLETPYYGILDQVAPALSHGGQDIILGGRALNRADANPVGRVPLDLVLRLRGFERVISLMTDDDGAFSHAYRPPPGETGIYQISVVHPDLVERPEHGRFSVAGLQLQYAGYRLSAARNIAQPLSIRATAGAGSAFSGLRFALDAADQPNGSLPPGIDLSFGAPQDLTAGASINLGVSLLADDSAAEQGTLVLRVLSDQWPGVPLDWLELSYRLVEAAPLLRIEPSSLTTGTTREAGIREPLTVHNLGLLPGEDVSVALVNPGGTVHDWIRIVSGSSLGDLAVGERRTFTLAFDPDTNVADGVYPVVVRASAVNAAPADASVAVTITPSGAGRILFKVEDIYTNTRDGAGHLIDGLQGASIRLQNEQLATIGATVTSGAGGEVLSAALPTGSYRYRVSAPDHEETSGRVRVRAGVVGSERVFLDSRVVTVEWSVTETEIPDVYQVTLTAVYQTDVPTAVVGLAPSSINLPALRAGDVFHGELTLTNHGLVRADSVSLSLPDNDPYLRYEILQESMPAILEAKQRVSVPYRLTALRDLAPDTSGGGCFSYTNLIRAGYSSICANGDQVARSAVTAITHRAGDCATGGGSGGGDIGGGIGGGGIGDIGSIGGGGGDGGTRIIDELSGLPPCRPNCNSCTKGARSGFGASSD